MTKEAFRHIYVIVPDMDYWREYRLKFHSHAMVVDRGRFQQNELMYHCVLVEDGRDVLRDVHAWQIVSFYSHAREISFLTDVIDFALINSRCAQKYLELP